MQRLRSIRRAVANARVGRVLNLGQDATNGADAFEPASSGTERQLSSAHDTRENEGDDPIGYEPSSLTPNEQLLQEMAKMFSSKGDPNERRENDPPGGNHSEGSKQSISSAEDAESTSISDSDYQDQSSVSKPGTPRLSSTRQLRRHLHSSGADRNSQPQLSRHVDVETYKDSELDHLSEQGKSAQQGEVNDAALKNEDSGRHHKSSQVRDRNTAHIASDPGPQTVINASHRSLRKRGLEANDDHDMSSRPAKRSKEDIVRIAQAANRRFVVAHSNQATEELLQQPSQAGSDDDEVEIEQLPDDEDEDVFVASEDDEDYRGGEIDEDDKGSEFLEYPDSDDEEPEPKSNPDSYSNSQKRRLLGTYTCFQALRKAVEHKHRSRPSNAAMRKLHQIAHDFRAIFQKYNMHVCSSGYKKDRGVVEVEELISRTEALISGLQIETTKSLRLIERIYKYGFHYLAMIFYNLSFTYEKRLNTTTVDQILKVGQLIIALRQRLYKTWRTKPKGTAVTSAVQTLVPRTKDILTVFSREKNRLIGFERRIKDEAPFAAAMRSELNDKTALQKEEGIHHDKLSRVNGLYIARLVLESDRVRQGRLVVPNRVRRYEIDSDGEVIEMVEMVPSKWQPAKWNDTQRLVLLSALDANRGQRDIFLRIIRAHCGRDENGAYGAFRDFTVYDILKETASLQRSVMLQADSDIFAPPVPPCLQDLPDLDLVEFIRKRFE